MADKKQRVLVLGGKGLVGHALHTYLKTRLELEVWATHHSPTKDWLIFDGDKPEKGLKEIFKTKHFDYVVNTIGLLQNDKKAKDPDYEAINTRLPLVMADLTEKLEFKLIHISTDAVFSPQAGQVDENSMPGPTDIYGKSKLQGEVTGENCLTIRTSIVGMDPYHHRGLLEWALAQEELTGYTNQVWSGCTNVQLAKLIGQAIDEGITGLMHFAPLGPVTKYELLKQWLVICGKRGIKIHKALGVPVNRYLITINPSIHRGYFNDITRALKEVYDYEKN